MKQVNGIDMELTQHNKLIEDVPEPDARVSIPMAILIWGMIYPMMLKVHYKVVPEEIGGFFIKL